MKNEAIYRRITDNPETFTNLELGACILRETADLRRLDNSIHRAELSIRQMFQEKSFREIQLRKRVATAYPPAFLSALIYSPDANLAKQAIQAALEHKTFFTYLNGSTAVKRGVHPILTLSAWIHSAESVEKALEDADKYCRMLSEPTTSPDPAVTAATLNILKKGLSD